MPGEILKVIVQKATAYWPERSTIVILMAPSFGAMLFAVAGREMDKASPVGWAMVPAVPLALLVVWFYTNRVPRTGPDKVGVIVAIAAENEEAERRLRADFIEQLRTLLLSDGKEGNFQLLVYSRRLAEKLDTTEAVLRLSEKSGAHFVVHGRVRTRLVNGAEAHILDLRGLVRHGLADEVTGQEIASEFNSVLPQRIQLPKENDVWHFEATSAWINLSARYVIGIAAFVSGDARYAEKLFLSVEQTISEHNRNLPHVRAIVRNLPTWFRKLYSAWLSYLAQRHVETRDDEWLKEAERIADKLLLRDPGSYSANLTKGICEFWFRRDIQAARRVIRKCRGTNDSSWHYSLAFLAAYEGKRDTALAEYTRAFRAPDGDPSVPNQCEEFIHLVLATEPNVVQLHFYSGLINLRAKGDHQGAIRDFREFLRTSEGRFGVERSLAQDYLREAERAAKPDAVFLTGRDANVGSYSPMSE